jgi:nucleotide-binding universal stress UspA family protein
MSMNKKILIATDGSSCSNQSLAYMSMLFADRPEIVFHLVNCVREGHGALPEPIDDKNSLFPDADEDEERSVVTNSCLNLAKERLIRTGITPERIKCSVIAAGSISKAIQTEAEQQLVDSILIARRGIGFVGEMLLGSVSADLFRKCHQVPLWIIDGEIRKKNFLLSVDGSCHSLMAADHLAYILSQREDVQIFLYHCRRYFQSKVEYNREQLYPRWDENWCKTYLMGDNPTYDGPFQLLLEAGIPKHRITVLPEATKIDSSSSIINQARRHQCGTIVMGRRRAGLVRGIWGEVASRTIKNTQDMALWIVG